MLVYLFIYVSLPPNFKHPQFQTPPISNTLNFRHPNFKHPQFQTPPISNTLNFRHPNFRHPNFRHPNFRHPVFQYTRSPPSTPSPPYPPSPPQLFNIKPSNRQNIASYPHLRVKMLTILDNLTCLCP